MHLLLDCMQKKGLPSFAGKSIGEILPIFLTSITVTGVKVGIICSTITIGKKIAKKILLLKEKNDDVVNHVKENNNDAIKKNKKLKKAINNRKIVNTDQEILDKPKILTKRK